MNLSFPGLAAELAARAVENLAVQHRLEEVRIDRASEAKLGRALARPGARGAMLGIVPRVLASALGIAGSLGRARDRVGRGNHRIQRPYLGLRREDDGGVGAPRLPAPTPALGSLPNSRGAALFGGEGGAGALSLTGPASPRLPPAGPEFAGLRGSETGGRSSSDARTGAVVAGGNATNSGLAAGGVIRFIASGSCTWSRSNEAPDAALLLWPGDQHQTQQGAAETAPGAEFGGVRRRAVEMIRREQGLAVVLEVAVREGQDRAVLRPVLRPRPIVEADIDQDFRAGKLAAGVPLMARGVPHQGKNAGQHRH